jgi:hypothetical protein
VDNEWFIIEVYAYNGGFQHSCWDKLVVKGRKRVAEVVSAHLGSVNKRSKEAMSWFVDGVRQLNGCNDYVYVCSSDYERAMRIFGIVRDPIV